MRKLGASRVEFFTALELPIKTELGLLESVQQAVDVYFSLGAVDEYFFWEGCTNERCKTTEGRPLKGFRMSVFPDILYLVLKRYDEHNRKITHFVEPTMLLNLNGRRYVLQSVVINRGITTTGHYWAIAKHTVEGSERWFVYNDSIRREATREDWTDPRDPVGRGQVYLLFYTPEHIAHERPAHGQLAEHTTSSSSTQH